jgi:hypothetical protein
MTPEEKRKYLPLIFLGIVVCLVIISLEVSSPAFDAVLTGHVVMVFDNGIDAEYIAYVANELASPGDSALTIDEADLTQSNMLIFSGLDDGDSAKIQERDGNKYVSGNVKDAIEVLKNENVDALLAGGDGVIEILDGEVVAEVEDDDGSSCQDDGRTVTVVDADGQSADYEDTCSGLDFIDSLCDGNSFKQVKYFCTSGCSAASGCAGDAHSGQEVLVGEEEVIEEVEAVVEVFDTICDQTDLGVSYTDEYGTSHYNNECTSHRNYDAATDSYIDSASYTKWICEDAKPKATGGWCENGEVCGADNTCVSTDATASTTICELSGTAYDTATRGTVTFTDADGIVETFSDECFVNYNDESWVKEYYCTVDGYDDVYAVGDYYCEFGCLDGVCHTEAVEAYCEDNVAGTDAFVEESVTIRNTEGYFSTTSDYCLGDVVYEYECSGVDAVTVETTCDYGCFGGRCLEENEQIAYTSCSDTDGQETSTQGEITLMTANYDYVYYVDYCVDTNTVAELSCQQDADVATVVTQEIDCAGVCEYGACVEAMTIDAFMDTYLGGWNTDVVVVIGADAPTSDLLGALRLASVYGLDVVLDSDIDDISSLKAISLGGATVNAVSAAAIDAGAVQSGTTSYYMYENKEVPYGTILVVAGSGSTGTRDAVDVLLS